MVSGLLQWRGGAVSSWGGAGMSEGTGDNDGTDDLLPF